MATRTRPWPSVVVVMGLLLLCVSAGSLLPDNEVPAAETLEPYTSPFEELPPEYTGSRFHQECLKTVPNRCSCTSLWDSPCNCNDTDKIAPPDNGTRCDCDKMCQEVWEPNRPLTPYSRYRCNIPQIRKVDVRIFLASKGNDSARVVPKVKRLMESMGSAINLMVHYVVGVTSNGFSSPRGADEVYGDMVGKCVVSMYSDPSVYLPFLVCMFQTLELVPRNLQNCTRLHPPINFAAVRSCVSDRGDILLRNDVLASQHYRVDVTPRLWLDERAYTPGSNTSYTQYEQAMCYVFSDPTRPFPWFIFFIMISVVLLAVVIFFTVKRWSRGPFLDTLQSLFFWNSTGPSETIDTLLYLRAYGHDFGDNNEAPPDPEPFDEDEEEESAEATSARQSAREERRRRRRERRERRERRRAERDSQVTSQNDPNATSSDNAANSSEDAVDAAPSSSEARTTDSRPSASPAAASAHPQTVDIALDRPSYYDSSDDEEGPSSPSSNLLGH